MRNTLTEMVYDDIGFEDITTNALMPLGIEIKGRIICKEKGLIAGAYLAATIFNEFGVQAVIMKQDGNVVDVDDVIMEINGDARSILSIERTTLNFLMRMSGIATITSKFVERAKKTNKDIIVAGTRKTTPGFQFFEKRAIKTGGGDTHRFRLDDCVLIKDNHLAILGDVRVAIRKARENVSFTKKIEVEVESQSDAIKAAKEGADIVMLDNMDPDEIERVLSALEDINLRDKVLIEASGGINLDNVAEYAEKGVDIISTGYLTHSTKVLDMSLEII